MTSVTSVSQRRRRGFCVLVPVKEAWLQWLSPSEVGMVFLA